MSGYIGAKQGVTQVDGYNRSEADAEFVNDPNDVIAVSGSNVGIGTTSPSTKLQVNGTVTATAFAGDGSALTNLPSGGGLGQGQSYSVVTGSRSLGVTYTNSTGAPILVSVSINNTSSTGAGNASLYVDGVQVALANPWDAWSYGYFNNPIMAQGIVPDGSTYYVSGSLASINFWVELR